MKYGKKEQLFKQKNIEREEKRKKIKKEKKEKFVKNRKNKRNNGKRYDNERKINELN